MHNTEQNLFVVDRSRERNSGPKRCFWYLSRYRTPSPFASGVRLSSEFICRVTSKIFSVDLQSSFASFWMSIVSSRWTSTWIVGASNLLRSLVVNSSFLFVAGCKCCCCWLIDRLELLCAIAFGWGVAWVRDEVNDCWPVLRCFLFLGGVVKWINKNVWGNFIAVNVQVRPMCLFSIGFLFMGPKGDVPDQWIPKNGYKWVFFGPGS